jgi:diaminopimelate decarboxylase
MHYQPTLTDAQKLAQDFGTPLYVYDAETMTRQLATFRQAFEGLSLDVHYAAKALTNLSVLKHFQRLGTGLDTVSLAEVEMGLMVGFSPGQIVFTPNCVAFAEIEAAVAKGVRINLENLPNLEKFGQVYGNSYPCCIRLHPDISASQETEKISAWHQQSKFGIARKQIAEVQRLRENYDLQIEGIHIHSSSKIMSPEVFLEGARTVFAIAMDFPDLRYLDFGGGVRVNYHEGEAPVDLFKLGELLRPAYRQFCQDYGRELELWFEPGRYLVGPAGVLLVEANVIKNNGHIDIVGVNSGFNHLIRPMMYGAYHQIANLSNPEGERKTYNVVGNICEIDNFAVQRELPAVREGDLLAILHAGAYGYSMASTYNSRFRPAEVLVEQGRGRLIRERDEMADLLRGQVEWGNE